MVRRISVVVLWVLATMVATAVALAAVGSVAGQVIDSPASPLLEATTTSLLAAATSPTSTSGVPLGTEPIDPITIPSTAGSAVDDTSTTSPTSAPAVTTQAPGGGATSTTAPDDDDVEEPETTSTTQAPAPSQTTTYQLIGGWVRITYGAGLVTLDGAGPNSGFTMNIDESGPGEVDVDFRNDDARSKFKAEWEGGELKVDIEEESEGD